MCVELSRRPVHFQLRIVQTKPGHILPHFLQLNRKRESFLEIFFAMLAEKDAFTIFVGVMVAVLVVVWYIENKYVPHFPLVFLVLVWPSKDARLRFVSPSPNNIYFHFPFNNNKKKLHCVLFLFSIPIYLYVLQGKLYKRFATQIYSFLTHNRKQRDYHSHSDKQPLEGEKKSYGFFFSGFVGNPFFLHVIILLIRSNCLFSLSP